MVGVWHKFKTKGFAVKVPGPEVRHKEDGELKRAISAADLVMLGVGSIIGSGVFVLTGEVATKAGPAVIISYIIASLAAMFSALCYAEFAVDIPVAGTAFNYIFAVFGEFMAWTCSSNLIMEYILTGASVAKGFTSYLATLLGQSPSKFVYHFPDTKYIVLDGVAAAVIAVLAIILIIGIKESAIFNNIVTGINLLTILFVIGLVINFFQPANLTPFAPSGARGIFHGASIVFFSYIGFDTLATIVEEVRNPKRDIPIGILGSMLICTILYVLMALAIVGLVKYTDIDVDAAFSAAFDNLGYGWASKIISAGALAGIITSLLATLLGQARISMVLARERFFPDFMAEVNPVTQTPIYATIVTSAASAVPALFLDLVILAEMVSVGMLFVLCLVCAGILWRRYHVPGSTENRVPLFISMAIVVVASMGVGLTSNFKGPLWLVGAFLGIWGVATATFCFYPVVYTSPNFNVPLKPLVPSLGILLTIHLIMSLGYPSYIRFAVWQVVGTAFYFFYSLHRTIDYSQKDTLGNHVPLINSGEEEPLPVSVTNGHPEADEE